MRRARARRLAFSIHYALPRHSRVAGFVKAARRARVADSEYYLRISSVRGEDRDRDLGLCLTKHVPVLRSNKYNLLLHPEYYIYIYYLVYAAAIPRRAAHRPRGEGGARRFQLRRALPAGGESGREDQEPQRRPLQLPPHDLLQNLVPLSVYSCPSPKFTATMQPPSHSPDQTIRENRPVASQTFVVVVSYRLFVRSDDRDRRVFRRRSSVVRTEIAISASA